MNFEDAARAAIVAAYAWRPKKTDSEHLDEAYKSHRSVLLFHDAETFKKIVAFIKPVIGTPMEKVLFDDMLRNGYEAPTRELVGSRIYAMPEDWRQSVDGRIGGDPESHRTLLEFLFNRAREEKETGKDLGMSGIRGPQDHKEIAAGLHAARNRAVARQSKDYGSIQVAANRALDHLTKQEDRSLPSSG